jgi:hypothetical protein
MIAQDRFKAIHDIVRPLISENYGLFVCDAALETPKTGLFDGTTITLSSRMDSEMSLFVLLHLFGHVVQWCTSETDRQLGLLTPTPATLTAELTSRIVDYETRAARYGLALLERAHLADDVRSWISDWTSADLRYLLDVYRNEVTADPFQNFRERYLRPGASLLEPLNIPPFVPRLFDMRFAF